MPDSTLNSRELLQQWQAGESAAARELFDRYVQRLIQLARVRLAPQFSSRIDPEDVVQSVYRSFFAHARQAEYVMQRSGDLWRLLAAITINKVRGQVAAHQAAKRDIRREIASALDDDGSTLDQNAVSATDSPEEAAMLLEVVQLQLGQAKAFDRMVLELRLSGSTVEEISQQVARSQRTVRRCLQQWEDDLQRRLASDE